MADALLELSVDAIQLVENHNPREAFDPTGLDQLARSIELNGVTSPILVSPGEGNSFTLIAGERRLRACKLAKCDTIPAYVRTDTTGKADVLAVVENVARTNLNPIEEAKGFAGLIADHGWSQKELAEHLSIKPTRVSQRLALLKLPEKTQAMLIADTLRLDHTAALRAVAAVDADFADTLARVIGNTPTIHADLLFAAERNHKPYATLIANSIGEEDLKRLGDADTTAAVDELYPQSWQNPRWDSDDVDAAKSYGCLITVPYTNQRGEKDEAFFICDRDFVIGRIAHKLEQTKISRAANATQNAGTNGDATEPGEAPTLKQLEAKAKAREDEAAKRGKAHAFNTEVGSKLAIGFHEPEVTLERMQLLADVIVNSNDNRHLAVASLALMDEKILTVNDRGTVKILGSADARAELQARIAIAKTPEAIMGLLLQALVGSQIVDANSLSPSQQKHYDFPGEYGTEPVAKRLALREALTVFKAGNTAKGIKAKLKKING